MRVHTFSIRAHYVDGTTREVAITSDEFATLLGGLDSHRYWLLADDAHREDGFVVMPGSDDPDDAAEILAVNALEDRLVTLDPRALEAVAKADTLPPPPPRAPNAEPIVPSRFASPVWSHGMPTR